MRIIECEQRSSEWFAARGGKPTASCFDKIVTSDGKQSKQRQKYMFQLAGEKIAGMPEEGFQSAAMLRGIEREDEARKFYEFTTGQEVQQVGFCVADGDKSGCSPDGLVGEDGMVEIKCPTLAVHVGYLLDGRLPVEYVQQVQGELFVTGRKWNDFISYFPGVRPFVLRVARDEAFISSLRLELVSFCAELEQVIKRIS